ncbi:MAG: hypothetical protein IPL42_12305 [Saprospiraceae bacterium]|nr:hypothetical protein [Saprospiraceae bacterium]
MNYTILDFRIQNSIKSNLILCILILNSVDNFTMSQTYICPLVGYDFQKVVSDPVNSLALKHKGFGFTSPLVGLKIKQRVYNQFYFQYSGDITHKHVRGYFNGGFLSDYLYHYNYFKNQLLLTFLWNNKLYLGAGKSFNVVNNFHYEDLENEWVKGDPIGNFNEEGWVIVLGLKYKKFDFESYYFKRDDINKKDIDFYYIKMHQVYSIGLRVSYDFKIFNGFKKKEKFECADFK